MRFVSVMQAFQSGPIVWNLKLRFGASKGMGPCVTTCSCTIMSSHTTWRFLFCSPLSIYPTEKSHVIVYIRIFFGKSNYNMICGCCKNVQEMHLGMGRDHPQETAHSYCITWSRRWRESNYVQNSDGNWDLIEFFSLHCNLHQFVDHNWTFASLEIRQAHHCIIKTLYKSSIIKWQVLFGLWRQQWVYRN